MDGQVIYETSAHIINSSNSTHVSSGFAYLNGNTASNMIVFKDYILSQEEVTTLYEEHPH